MLTLQTCNTDSFTIEDCIHAQLEKHPHSFTDWRELTLRIATDKALNGAYLGAYSITYGRKRQTLVAQTHKWCGKPVSASSIARVALEPSLQAIGRKRLFWNKRCLPLLEIPQPLYCNPVDYAEELIYVDVKACYYKLYSNLPVFLFYWGLRPISGDIRFRDVLPSNLQDYKLVRNSLVGVLRATRSTRVRDYKIHSYPNRNKFLSPCHWGAMAELLHYFAAQAVACNCIYYNTDGAIFRTEEDATNWAVKMSEWGMETSIKGRGAGRVSAIGNYHIAGMNTSNRLVRGRPYNNLLEANPYIVDMYQRLL